MQWEQAGRLEATLEGICECGLRLGGVEVRCSDLRDRLIARHFQEPLVYGRSQRLAVDAYCLQHAAYVESATSFAAHLGGLCIALEHGNHPQLHARLVRWLNRDPNTLVKPPLPAQRGALTIAHVSEVSGSESYAGAVGEWAESVWQAYASEQVLARTWVQQALSSDQR